MGQAQIILREDNIGEEEDVVVTLVESGQAEYLGQVSYPKRQIISCFPQTQR